MKKVGDFPSLYPEDFKLLISNYSLFGNIWWILGALDGLHAGFFPRPVVGGTVAHLHRHRRHLRRMEPPNIKPSLYLKSLSEKIRSLLSTYLGESPSEPSYSKRSSSQYHHRNAERAKVRGSSNIESERYNRRYERPSESYKYRNPPSTERTISARGQRRGETNYGPIRREHSLNSYQSLEYRRHEYRDHSHSSRHLQSAKALWVEKQKNKETQPANLELSESSRPHVIPPGETKDPHHPPANIPVEILDLARKEIRDYMEQYSNCQDPTESAARKERLRQAEEQGELEEAATSLVRNSLESQRIEEVIRVPEASPDRIPVSQRLGPISESQSAFNRLGSLTSPQARAAPLSLQSGRKRKAAKTPLRRTTPLSLAMVNAGIRKRRILKDTRSNKIIPPREENRSKRIPLPEGMQSLKVSDLIHQETSEWNIEQIERCLPFHKEQILKIKPSTLRIEDTLVWMKNPTGEYTTRSGYLTFI
ncbi:hypothetical protein HID58_010999 [Brassica napus]|uniref:Uncharacterized protein n=1 Tax=Brassica napus TaxID=3708 RepID=A0ABQ8DWW4_BRANA|nr:hypothetical protein HID58_010999 [Brassica napus]